MSDEVDTFVLEAVFLKASRVHKIIECVEFYGRIGLSRVEVEESLERLERIGAVVQDGGDIIFSTTLRDVCPRVRLNGLSTEAVGSIGTFQPTLPMGVPPNTSLHRTPPGCVLQP